MLILQLAAFLLPLLLGTTTASVLGNSQSKELKAVHAKDLKGEVAVPRSNSNSVSEGDGTVPSGHFILFRKLLSRLCTDLIFLGMTLIIALYS
jgi:hypothetical protein